MRVLSRKLAYGCSGGLAVLAVCCVVAVMRSATPLDVAAKIDAPESAPASEKANSNPARLTLAGKSFRDPSVALAALSELAEAERMPFAMQLAHEWARQDFDAARDWVFAQDETLRLELLNPLGRAGIAKHPLEAMALADSFSNDESKFRFLTVMVQEWTAVDSSAAVQWLKECDHPAKASMQGALAIQLAQKNPVQAAAFVALDMEPGDAQDSAALTVATRWAYIDSQAAEAWARSLPESDLQLRLLAAVASLSQAH